MAAGRGLSDIAQPTWEATAVLGPRPQPLRCFLGAQLPWLRTLDGSFNWHLSSTWHATNSRKSAFTGDRSELSSQIWTSSQCSCLSLVSPSPTLGCLQNRNPATRQGFPLRQQNHGHSRKSTPPPHFHTWIPTCPSSSINCHTSPWPSSRPIPQSYPFAKSSSTRMEFQTTLSLKSLIFLPPSPFNSIGLRLLYLSILLYS